MAAKRDAAKAELAARVASTAELDAEMAVAAAAFEAALVEPMARRNCLGSRTGQKPPQGRREAGGSAEALSGSGAGAPSTATAATPPSQTGPKRTQKIRNARRHAADIAALPANRETLLKADAYRRLIYGQEADRELGIAQGGLFQSFLFTHSCCEGEYCALGHDDAPRSKVEAWGDSVRDGKHAFLKPAVDGKGEPKNDVVVYHSLTSAGFLSVPTVHCSLCNKDVQADPLAAGCSSSSASEYAKNGYTRFISTLAIETYRTARFRGYLSAEGDFWAMSFGKGNAISFGGTPQSLIFNFCISNHYAFPVCLSLQPSRPSSTPPPSSSTAVCRR